ncbi:MAG TPA: efflux RND transporter periplasmic adaptor subunit, partial [Blastocatellia bacterium]|nr:efflux RND transporter periplasmic adaptor subunit [Blastocatellia bacterium]
DMNASVDFVTEAKAEAENSTSTESNKTLYIPASAVRDGAVFVYLNGKAMRKTVKTGTSSQQGVRIDDGLLVGEDVIVNPPAGLKDGDRVKSK